MTVEAPEVGSSIELFVANVKGGTAAQRCAIKSTMKPLECQIQHLTGNKTYIVQVKSCTPDESICSTALENSTFLRAFAIVLCLFIEKLPLTYYTRGAITMTFAARLFNVNLYPNHSDEPSTILSSV